MFVFLVVCLCVCALYVCEQSRIHVNRFMFVFLKICVGVCVLYVSTICWTKNEDRVTVYWTHVWNKAVCVHMCKFVKSSVCAWLVITVHYSCIALWSQINKYMCAAERSRLLKYLGFEHSRPTIFEIFSYVVKILYYFGEGAKSIYIVGQHVLIYYVLKKCEKYISSPKTAFPVSISQKVFVCKYT